MLNMFSTETLKCSNIPNASDMMWEVASTRDEHTGELDVDGKSFAQKTNYCSTLHMKQLL